MANRLQDATRLENAKAKSYQKDEVLLQLINAQQTQKKAIQAEAEKLFGFVPMQKKNTKISGYYKESEGYIADPEPHIAPQFRSQFTVTTRSM